MPEIISRAEAKARGLTRYFTGEPCKHGHVDERKVSNRRCCECLRVENRLRFRALRQYHPEKLREKKKAWYQRNRENILKRVARSRRDNIESYRAYQKANRDYYRSYARKRSSKVSDLIAVLREEMPELLKEFGL